MKKDRKFITGSLLALISVLGWLVWFRAVHAASGVTVAFGPAGLSSLKYQGLNMLAYGDFRVNRVVMKDRAGNTFDADLTSVARVDPARGEVKRIYTWGALVIHYGVPVADRLNVTITTKNTSGFSIQSVFYEPFALKLPVKPREYDGSTPLLGHNIGTPTAITLSVGSDVITLVNDDVQKPLLVGFPWALDRPTSTVFPVRVNTGRDSMYPDSLPFVERSIAPGQSDEYRLSVLFGKRRSDGQSIVPADLWARFASTYPSTLNWDDHRPIGHLELATAAAGYRNNPRGWFMDSKLDVSTPDGLQDFEARLMSYADQSTAILREMNAQGMIVWDIEGEEFQHAVTYIGDPRQIASLAPEMDRLADRFFARFRDLGFRVGVCIRPQTFTKTSPTGPHQTESPDPYKVLSEKIAYARKRWDATLFYIDSNGGPNSPMDPEIIHRVAATFPDILLVPEHSNLRYYAYSAPYHDLRQNAFRTADAVRTIYPKAFSIVNTTDGPVDQHYDELITAVTKGDILLYRTWYREPVQNKLKIIYESSQAAISPLFRPLIPALFAGYGFGVQFRAIEAEPVAW